MPTTSSGDPADQRRQNGLDDRRALTAKAKAALARDRRLRPEREAPPSKTAPCCAGARARRGRRASAHAAEARLHGRGGRRLRRRYGRSQCRVPEQQQLDPVDGIVGKDTWTALDIAGQRQLVIAGRTQADRGQDKIAGSARRPQEGRASLHAFEKRAGCRGSGAGKSAILAPRPPLGKDRVSHLTRDRFARTASVARGRAAWGRSNAPGSRLVARSAAPSLSPAGVDSAGDSGPIATPAAPTHRRRRPPGTGGEVHACLRGEWVSEPRRPQHGRSPSRLLPRARLRKLIDCGPLLVAARAAARPGRWATSQSASPDSHRTGEPGPDGNHPDPEVRRKRPAARRPRDAASSPEPRSCCPRCRPSCRSGARAPAPVADEFGLSMAGTPPIWGHARQVAVDQARAQAAVEKADSPAEGPSPDRRPDGPGSEPRARPERRLGTRSVRKRPSRDAVRTDPARRLGARPQGPGDLHHARDARLQPDLWRALEALGVGSSSCRARASASSPTSTGRAMRPVRWTIPSSRPCSRAGAAFDLALDLVARTHKPAKPAKISHLEGCTSMKARIVLVGALVAEARPRPGRRRRSTNRATRPARCSRTNPPPAPRPSRWRQPTSSRCPLLRRLRHQEPGVGARLQIAGVRNARARGTVHSNTGEFDFAVRSVPALRSTDRLRVQPTARPCREVTDRRPDCGSARTTGAARRGPTATSTRCRSRSSTRRATSSSRRNRWPSSRSAAVGGTRK